MSTTSTAYNHFWLALLRGTIQLGTDTIKCLLVSSAYVPDAEHTVLADVSAYEITGTGYTAGGAALAGVTTSRTGAVARFDADNLVFAALTATFRRAILYADVSRNGLVKPLIAHLLLDATPADVSVAGTDYPIVWATAGIVTNGPAA